MYKKTIIPGYTGRMKSVECFEGEQIEEKVRRIVNNNEPITDGAPIIFTEKKDGVLPEYNIRTGRWDIALDAMNKMEMSSIVTGKQIGRASCRERVLRLV